MLSTMRFTNGLFADLLENLSFYGSVAELRVEGEKLVISMSGSSANIAFYASFYSFEFEGPEFVPFFFDVKNVVKAVKDEQFFSLEVHKNSFVIHCDDAHFIFYKERDSGMIRIDDLTLSVPVNCTVSYSNILQIQKLLRFDDTIVLRSQQGVCCEKNGHYVFLPDISLNKGFEGFFESKFSRENLYFLKFLEEMDCVQFSFGDNNPLKVFFEKRGVMIGVAVIAPKKEVK